MQVDFRAFKEPEPGRKWARVFRRLWPAYQKWYLREGEGSRPTLHSCACALRDHMPELVPTYERLVELAGGSDLAGRFLSLYRPPAYLSGCSQAAWSRGEPLLVRNYDYSPRFWEGSIVQSAWTGRRVIGVSDCLWDLLDGMNDSGLCASLSFGGSRRVGSGFGIPILLRYVLETCATTGEASRALCRLPSHMAYNVTLLDRDGDSCTVLLGPDREAVVSPSMVATNHQEPVEWWRFVEVTRSLEREQFLRERLADPAESRDDFVSRFRSPPLLSRGFGAGWGTLYTAIYEPHQGRVTHRLADHSRSHTFDDFNEERLMLDYGASSEEGPLLSE
jgi:predicted choloylglycine hydrolase